MTRPVAQHPFVLMVEVARLLIEIDSSAAKRGVDDVARSLEGLSAQAADVSAKTGSLARTLTASAAATKETAGAADLAAREVARATAATERFGTANYASKRLAKELAAEVLGLHGPLVGLVSELGNVNHLFSQLGAIALSPLGVIGLVAAGVQGLRYAFRDTTPEIEEHRKELEKLGHAYQDAVDARSPLGRIAKSAFPEPYRGTGYGIDKVFGATESEQKQLDELRARLSSREALALSRGGDQDTDEARALIRDVQGITDAILVDLPKQTIHAQIAIEEALKSSVFSGKLYANDENSAAFEKAVKGTEDFAAGLDRRLVAEREVYAAQKQDIEATEQRAAATAVFRTQLDAQIASMNRAAQFADQGADAIERATRVQNLYDLALKASGGDTGLAGDRFREGLKAMEAEEAARRRAKDIAEEEAEILRGNAKLAQEMAADEERRQQRQEAARASAQAEISALSRRVTGLGAIPDTLGGFESARREQDIQSKLAAYRAKIADLPFDEQESAAARYEATLRDVVERETAWTDQEKLLKDELEQSKKAIEEHQKRVEDLAHAYADPLGKGLDDLFGKLQDGELSWKSFAETALNAMKEISAGVFHELVTRPFTESIVNTLTGRSGNGGGLGGDFYGGSGGGGGGFGSGDSSNYGAVGLSGASAASGVFASAAGSGVGAGLRKWLPSLFGGRTSNPPYPDALNAAYARAQSGTPSFDASDRLYFGGGGRLPWDDSSATAQPTSGIIDPKSTPGGTGGFGFMDFFNLLGLGTQSWLQNPGGLFLGGGGGGGFGFGFARGAAFSRGRVIPFYRGDVFDNPTTFPMAGGDTGLLGERGPEAILPLSRGSDGRLGVRASGARGGSGDERDRGGGTTVINNWRITTPNADSFRKSKRHMDQDEKRRASRG